MPHCSPAPSPWPPSAAGRGSAWSQAARDAGPAAGPRPPPLPRAVRRAAAVRQPGRPGGAGPAHRTRASPRDRLFDILMRRIDFLQRHRAGVLALLRHLPADPPTALALARGQPAQHGLDAGGRRHFRPRAARRGCARKGLLAVWLWTLRAWRATTARISRRPWRRWTRRLSRAEQAEGWLGRPPRPAPPRPAPPHRQPNQPMNRPSNSPPFDSPPDEPAPESPSRRPVDTLRHLSSPGMD